MLWVVCVLACLLLLLLMVVVVVVVVPTVPQWVCHWFGSPMGDWRGTQCVHSSVHVRLPGSVRWGMFSPIPRNRHYKEWI